ncbi:MAG: LysR family transcriptional regulator [Pseudomonadota bacterium]
MIIIHVMNDMDLNLLSTFHAIYEERHVSRAAERLGLSQPAMSNALRRLREHLGNPLFVRAKHGVLPTPFADDIAPTIRQVLTLLEDGIRNASQFSPATTTREFQLALSDVAEVSILPGIVQVCRSRAPGLKLSISQLDRESMDSSLENGTVDLCIGYMPKANPSLYQQALFRTDYVCIARKRHPRIKGKLTREIFADCEHAVASADATGHMALKEALALTEPVAKVSITTPHFFALPFIVANTELLALCPRPLIPKIGVGRKLAIHEAPIELPLVEVKMFWHERVHRDSAHTWLRETIREAFAIVDWNERS